MSTPLGFLVLSNNIQPRPRSPKIPHCLQILLAFPGNVKKPGINDSLCYCYQGNKIEHFECLKIFYLICFFSDSFNILKATSKIFMTLFVFLLK